MYSYKNRQKTLSYQELDHRQIAFIRKQKWFNLHSDISRINVIMLLYAPMAVMIVCFRQFMLLAITSCVAALISERINCICIHMVEQKPSPDELITEALGADKQVFYTDRMGWMRH